MGNVTVELEFMVMPLPAEEEPKVRKFFSLPVMEKEVGVFKVTLTNEDNNMSVMEVLSMEFWPVPKEDPARLKNASKVEFHIIPGVCDDAV